MIELWNKHLSNFLIASASMISLNENHVLIIEH